MAVVAPDVLASGYVTFREWRAVVESLARMLGARPPIRIDVEVPVEHGGRIVAVGLGGARELGAERVELGGGAYAYVFEGGFAVRIGDSLYTQSHRLLPRTLVSSGLLTVSVRSMWRRRGGLACAEFAYSSSLPSPEPAVLAWAVATLLDLQTHATLVDAGLLSDGVVARGGPVFSLAGVASSGGLRPVLGMVASEPDVEVLAEAVREVAVSRGGVVEVKPDRLASLALRTEALAGFYTVDVPDGAVAPPRTSPRLELWVRASRRPIFALGVALGGSMRVFVFEDLATRLRC